MPAIRSTRWVFMGAAALLAVLGTSQLDAAVITVTIGDNDGFGFGIADGGFTPTDVYDNRSAAELAASDGSQFTDFAPDDPILTVPPVSVALADDIISGAFVFDVQGVELPQHEILFNGISQGTIFDFTFIQGPTGSGVVTVPLSATVISAANSADEFTFAFDPSGAEGDIIGFDYFELSVETASIPEPTSLALLGAGICGMGLARRRRWRR